MLQPIITTLYISLSQGWENVLFELASARLNETTSGRMPRGFLQALGIRHFWLLSDRHVNSVNLDIQGLELHDETKRILLVEAQEILADRPCSVRTCGERTLPHSSFSA